MSVIFRNHEYCSTIEYGTVPTYEKQHEFCIYFNNIFILNALDTSHTSLNRTLKKTEKM